MDELSQSAVAPWLISRMIYSMDVNFVNENRNKQTKNARASISAWFHSISDCHRLIKHIQVFNHPLWMRNCDNLKFKWCFSIHAVRHKMHHNLTKLMYLPDNFKLKKKPYLEHFRKFFPFEKISFLKYYLLFSSVYNS